LNLSPENCGRIIAIIPETPETSSPNRLREPAALRANPGNFLVAEAGKKNYHGVNNLRQGVAMSIPVVLVPKLLFRKV
jgi:hypothetical protein